MNRLSSLALTLWSLGAVCLCILVGMVLAQIKPFAVAMPAMDRGLIMVWLPAALGGGAVSAALGAWFLALCGAVGLLLANLCACSLTRLWPRLKNRGKAHGWLLFLAHALMAVILLGHLSQMSLGFKREGLKLLPGQTAELPGGFAIKLEQLVFVDDLALLNLNYRQGRRAHTTRAFHRRQNLARVRLLQDGRALTGGVLQILSPLTAGAVRVTLSDFFRQESKGPARVGAVLTVTKNPLTAFFFAAYLAWIAVYLALAARAFRRRPGLGHQSKGDQP